MVLVDSHRISPVPWYSGTPRRCSPYVYRAITYFGVAFQTTSASARRSPCAGPTTPLGPKPQRFGLVPFRSPLLAESRLMSFPPGTEMFQFPGFAWRGYGFTASYRASTVGCPIRKSADQRLLAPPHGLSQRATSFIASQCQGILQMLFRRLIVATFMRRTKPTHACRFSSV